MKAILFINGPQGYETLVHFSGHPCSLEVIVPHGSDNGPIRRFCMERGIKIGERAKGVPHLLGPDSHDYLVSSSFPYKILPEEYNHATIAAVNIHGAVLPKYKGKNAGVWALINDEKRIGMTLHRINEKFDDGEILHIDYHEINDEMSLDDIQKLLAKSLLRIVNLLVAGEVFRSPFTGASRESIFWRTRAISDSLINWHVPARKAFLFIRALSREPIYAFSYYNGVQYRLKGSKLSARKSDKLPGTIIDAKGQPLIVCGDETCLEITDYDCNGSGLAEGMVLH